MFTFLNYTYYNICRFYDNNGASNAKITAVIVIALIQYLNLYAIFLLINLILNTTLHLGKLLIFILYTLAVILNGIRYNKFNYDILKERWDNEDKRQRKKKVMFVILYIVLSSLFAFGLAIYLGSKKSNYQIIPCSS